jgi:hypothetical protein
LLIRSGELGLLGVDVRRFGGVALDKVSAVVVGEAIGVCASFATFGAQTGCRSCRSSASAQKHSRKYICRASCRAARRAYCLSESGSGSTPSARARLSSPTDHGA